MSFVPRLVRPEKNNKYYITKSKGGYSNAIVGKPTDSLCNVLSNCVGYAYGRFHEIANDPKMSYCCPVGAEDFPDYIRCCKTGSKPKLGAIICWQKGKARTTSDGCGHVAVVERILSDTQILISQSGYNSNKIFWTEICTYKNGEWVCSWMGTTYKFRCFIYNPAVCDEESEVVTLMSGSKGKLVKELQTNLNTIGNYKLTVDGSFGPATEKAIKDIQTKNKLTVDGIVGPATQVVINNLLKQFIKPEGVIDLEFLLDNKKVSCWATVINGQNYIRLADLDDLGIVKSVSYNSTKKIPEVKRK